MAQQLHLSEGYLQTIYKNAFGLSCMDDCIRARIRLAKDQLLYTEKTVVSVAEFCGYRNVEHFCRQFKQCTGLSPGNSAVPMKYRISSRQLPPFCRTAGMNRNPALFSLPKRYRQFAFLFYNYPGRHPYQFRRKIQLFRQVQHRIAIRPEMYPAKSGASGAIDAGAGVISVPDQPILIRDIRVMARPKLSFPAAGGHQGIIFLCPTGRIQQVGGQIRGQQPHHIGAVHGRAGKGEKYFSFPRSANGPSSTKV